MASLNYYEVYLKIGDNEWMDEPAGAVSDRDAIQVVLNRRAWTKNHITIQTGRVESNGYFAQVRMLKRDPFTGEFSVVSCPRLFGLKYI